MDVLIVRNDAQHGDAADVLQHPAAFVEKPHVATELVDDDALDALTVFGCLEHDAAIDGSEDAPTVDVAHQDDVGIGMTGHRQVHQIPVLQVNLGDAAGTLHHDGVVARGEAVEGIADFSAEVDMLVKTSPNPSCRRGILATPEVVGIAIADGLAVEHHLGGMVRLRLQQQRVHVGMTGNARRLGLYGLGTAYLQPLGGGV